MKIYFSGGSVRGVWQPVNELLLQRGGARLLSFAYKRDLPQFCSLVRETAAGCADLLMDSGAFTAWSKGDQVDIIELGNLFADLQQEYSDCVDFSLINLDVIPGRKGVDPTPDEIAAAMKQSLVNYEVLNTRFPGKVLPVYHQGEPEWYRQELFNATDHICLSPRNDVAEKYRIKWAQEAQNMTHKFHGLATTGTTMMETVNWYSVDSAGWVMVGGMGSIMFPSATGLKPVAISAQSPSKQVWNKHIDNMPERDYLLDFVIEKGYTIEDLQATDIPRYKWNLERLLDYQEKYAPRHYFEKGLFDL